MRLNKKQRIEILSKTNGVCFYCGIDVSERFQVDHFYPIRRNGDGTMMHPERDCMENMIPACQKCNKFKSSLPLESFRHMIQKFVNSLNLYHNQYFFAKKYGLVEETGKDVTFWFENSNYDMTELNKFK